MDQEKNAEVFAWTKTGAVYSRSSLIETQSLAKLKSAARTKHLLLATYPQLIRSIWKVIFGSANKIDYTLPRKTNIQRNFIRQDPWEIEYLYPIFKRSKVGILEIGRFNGGTSLVAATANKLVPIFSIDLAPQDDKNLLKLFMQLDIGKNVNLIVGDSQNTQYDVIDDYDVLFIDGDHSFEGCLADLKNWYPKLKIGGHILLHDCYFGCEVQESVISFMKSYEVDVIIPPYKSHEHRRYETGSLCHLIKR